MSHQETPSPCPGINQQEPEFLRVFMATCRTNWMAVINPSSWPTKIEYGDSNGGKVGKAYDLIQTSRGLRAIYHNCTTGVTNDFWTWCEHMFLGSQEIMNVMWAWFQPPKRSHWFSIVSPLNLSYKLSYRWFSTIKNLFFDGKTPLSYPHW